MNLSLFDSNTDKTPSAENPDLPVKVFKDVKGSDKKKRGRKTMVKKEGSLLTGFIHNPIWLTMSEASKLGGVNNKTIRRAIQSKNLKYKIVGNRYFVDISSLVHYLHTSKKLKNKLNSSGIGQYIDSWKK